MAQWPACASATWAWTPTAIPDRTSPPGPEIRARTTVVAEGCRGSLAKELIAPVRAGRRADPRRPSRWASRNCGSCRRAAASRAWCSTRLGWPLDSCELRRQLRLSPGRRSRLRGLCGGPRLRGPATGALRGLPAVQASSVDPRAARGRRDLQAAGARTIAAGGWQSMPAARHARRAAGRRCRRHAELPEDQGHPPGHPLRQPGGASTWWKPAAAAGFDARWRASEGGAELREVRNIKPGFRRGLWWGLANAAL